MKKAFLFLVIAAMFAATFTSCARQGYGCKGRSKYITGYRD